MSGVQDLGDISKPGGEEKITGTMAPRDSTDTQKAEEHGAWLKKPKQGPGELLIYDQSYLQDEDKDADKDQDNDVVMASLE